MDSKAGRYACALRSFIALCLIGGCQLPPPAPIVHQPMTARPQGTLPPRAANGAIFQAGGVYRPLFEDVRARNVGDTLIIQIQERTAANKKGSSQANREAETSASVTSLNRVPGKSVLGLSVGGESSNTFSGGGQAASSNDFTGAIAVTVVEVLANGNLVVSGEKQIAMSQGTEYIRFSGVVNPRLISVANSVASTQVAEARIEYKANGYIDEAMVMGWLGRFFLSFLPF